jgi:hypothetical protein
MSLFQVREQIFKLNKEAREWIEENDFTRITGYSSSYFHKIVKQLRNANSASIKYQTNSETGKERVCLQKSALLDYLSGRSSRPQDGFEWNVEGSTPYLLALRDALDQSETIALNEGIKFLDEARHSLMSARDAEDLLKFMQSVGGKIFDEIKQKYPAKELTIFLNDVEKRFYEKFWENEKDYTDCFTKVEKAISRAQSQQQKLKGIQDSRNKVIEKILESTTEKKK